MERALFYIFNWAWIVLCVVGTFGGDFKLIEENREIVTRFKMFFLGGATFYSIVELWSMLYDTL